MPPLAAGGSLTLRTESRATRRCTRPASPATRLRKIATMSSPITHLNNGSELLARLPILVNSEAARSEGADLILTARDPERLQRVGIELGASVTAFDATDFQRLGRFFDELPKPIDHVLVTGPGPYYAPLAEFDFEAARRDLEAHILLPLQVARKAVGKVRPGGTLLFMGGTGGRTAVGLA